MGIIAGLLVQNTLKYLLNFGQVRWGGVGCGAVHWDGWMDGEGWLCLLDWIEAWEGGWAGADWALPTRWADPSAAAHSVLPLPLPLPLPLSQP